MFSPNVGVVIKPGLTIRFLALDSDAAAALERLRVTYRECSAAVQHGGQHPIAAALRAAGARPGVTRLHVDEVDHAWRAGTEALQRASAGQSIPAPPMLRDVTYAVLSLAAPGQDGLRAADLLDVLSRPPMNEKTNGAWKKARYVIGVLASRAEGSLNAVFEKYAEAVTASLEVHNVANTAAPARLTAAGLAAVLDALGIVARSEHHTLSMPSPPTAVGVNGGALVISGVRLRDLHPLVRDVLPSDDLYLLATPPENAAGDFEATAGHSWVVSASAAIDGEVDAESWEEGDGAHSSGGHRATTRSWRLDLHPGSRLVFALARAMAHRAAGLPLNDDPDGILELPFRLATTGTLFGGVQALATGFISLLDVLAGERSFVIPLAAAPCLCDVLDEGALPLSCTVVVVRVDVDLL